MTNTALKAQIDSQITSKTVSSSITPTNVGANMKAVVDYVDQQQGLYKSWRAICSPTSVVEVLRNDLNLTSLIVSNPSNGNVRITKAGFTLPSTKLDLIVSNINNAGTPYMTTIEVDSVSVFPDTAVLVNIWNMAGTQTSTPSSNFIVEIRIYN